MTGVFGQTCSTVPASTSPRATLTRVLVRRPAPIVRVWTWGIAFRVPPALPLPTLRPPPLPRSTHPLSPFQHSANSYLSCKAPSSRSPPRSQRLGTARTPGEGQSPREGRGAAGNVGVHSGVHVACLCRGGPRATPPGTPPLPSRPSLSRQAWAASPAPKFADARGARRGRVRLRAGAPGSAGSKSRPQGATSRHWSVLKTEGRAGQ